MSLLTSSAVGRARSGRLVRNLMRLGLSGALALASALAGASGAPPSAVQASGGTFLVDSVVDSPDNNPGDGSCVAVAGGCTLRAAVDEANADAGLDTVLLPNSADPLTYTLTSTLVITNPVEVKPVSGSNVGLRTISGAGAVRILDVAAGASLTLSGVTLIEAGLSGSLRMGTGSTVNLTSVAITGGAGLAILNLGGTLSLTNATLSGNAGGLSNSSSGTTTLTHSTVAYNVSSTAAAGGLDNASGSVTLRSSILVGNSGGAQAQDCSGTITTQGYNVLGDLTNCGLTPAGTDQAGRSAAEVLTPLANNGGSSFTHALAASSPALDKGNPALCPSSVPTDQRGAVRFQGAACDAGAYELPLLSLSTASLTVDEGGTATVTARLEKSTPYTVTAVYSTTNLTAVGGADFAATTGTLVIPRSSPTSTFTITVPITADGIYELAETFRLDLLTPAGAGLGVTRTTTITLTNLDPAPVVQWASAAYTATEGAGPAVLTAALDRPSELTTTVNYTTTAGTARAGADFTAQSGTLTFPPLSTSQPVTVPVAADAVYENAEAFTVRLTAPVGNGSLGARTTATVTVQNSNPAPSVAFVTSATAVREDAGTVAPAVRLSAVSEVTATVQYAAAGGTATSGVDYTVQGAGTLTFAPGITTTSLPVSLVDDFEYEGTETVTLTLSSPSAATLGAPAAQRLDLLDSDSRLWLGGVAKEFNPYDEVEPNDSFTQATGPLTSGRPYYGTFKGTRDLDFFFFDTTATGQIRVEIAGLLQSTKVNGVDIPGAQVQLCADSDPFCVPYIGYSGGYEPGTTLFRIVVNNRPAGRYWVAVVMPDGYTGGRYTLTVTHP
ncbi:MAG: hypothetical protein JNK29_10000 [Anaerolineales bacterium]|nr:hypothetical protein [Anaerolineales bacterium]